MTPSDDFGIDLDWAQGTIDARKSPERMTLRRPPPRTNPGWVRLDAANVGPGPQAV